MTPNKPSPDLSSTAKEKKPFALDYSARISDLEARVAILERFMTYTHRKDWECKAAPWVSAEPQECKWPHCGCDPGAKRVLEALASALAVEERPER